MLHVSASRWGGLGWGGALFLCFSVCVRFFFFVLTGVPSLPSALLLSSMNQEWNNEQFVWMNICFLCTHKYFIVVILTNGSHHCWLHHCTNSQTNRLVSLIKIWFYCMAEHRTTTPDLCPLFCLLPGAFSLFTGVLCVYVEFIFMNRYQGMVQKEVILGGMKRLESCLVTYSSLYLLCFVCRLGRSQCELCYGCRQMVFVL